MSLVETFPTPETETWGASCVEGDGTANDPGDIDPDGGDVAHGWAESEEPPPRQRWNWVLKLVHRITRLWRQRGLPAYSADETYPPGARVTYGDGVVSFQRIGAGDTKGTAPTDITKWMHWGHTTEQLEDAVDAHLGDYSGELSTNDITPTGGSTVSYARVQRFPNSTDKTVYFRLSLAKGQGGWSETLTLSGGAAFSNNGALGAQATVMSWNANTGTGIVTATTVNNGNSVVVAVAGGDLSGSNAVMVNVAIQGY